jgi:eukaryotic-like serine/threonine-protein kinase
VDAGAVEERVGDGGPIDVEWRAGMRSLTPGDRIGPYEVVAAIGAGGMGEVYRAHDTTLGRPVALKVLPPGFAGDPARLARLRHEARVLATVNHPNVAAIYGLVDSHAGPALVLEFVDGLTLSDRLEAGPLPIADTLKVSRQIADALEAAHECGVVHRDLKPANVIIRPDGTVKVLDFGVAKLLDPRESSSDEATMTVDRTAAGVVIGTAPYMSPEQARGDKVTRQSDVWSFGAMLFEMLSGRRAFAGSTTSDVLAAILLTTPDWEALPPSTPPSIVRLVRRCLEREPKARLHDIGDARLELEDAERALQGAAPQAVARGRGTSPSPRRTMAWMAGGALVTLAAAIAIFRFLPITSAPAAEFRLQLAPPSGMRFVSVPAISSDGRDIVFAAVADAGGEQRIWRRALNAPTATELPGTEGARYPFWSADNRFVGFFADGKLRRIAVAGGNPVDVCDAPAGRGGLWLNDDTIVFAPGAFDPLMRVSAAGGAPSPYTQLADDETGHRFPQRLPGRQLLYFSVNRTPSQSGTRLIAIDDPHRTVAFVPTRGAAEYVNGHFVFVPNGNSEGPLLAQPMTLPDGQPFGEPIPIGETRISETNGRFVMATSPSGVIAWLGPALGVGQFTWIARDGRVLETVGAPAAQLGVELSPDRQQLATVVRSEIWTMPLARPVSVRVTPPGRAIRHPIWSPDGAQILALDQSRGIGTFDLITTRVASGDVVDVRPRANFVTPLGWTRDGQWVWTEGVASLVSTVWRLPPGREPVPVIEDGARPFEARVSPDGHWIAFSSSRSGRFQIEVTTFAARGPLSRVDRRRRVPAMASRRARALFPVRGFAADGRLVLARFAAGHRHTHTAVRSTPQRPSRPGSLRGV